MLQRFLLRRLALIVLVLIEVLMTVIGVTVLVVEEDPLEREAQWLVATFAAGMGIFALALTWIPLRRGERWAWLALWYLPVFFVLHVYAFETVVPDLMFAVLSALALFALQPRRGPLALGR